MVKKNKLFIKYFNEHFTSLREAEKVLDISYQSAVHYLEGLHEPNIRTIQRIARKSKGAIPVTSWQRGIDHANRANRTRSDRR
jgi:hypothetical protein